MGERRTAFDPAVHGFSFPNAFVDVLLTLPSGKAISTAGRCGGMAYASLDLFHAGVPAPRWGAGLFAPQRVPPDDNWLADTIRARLFDSFMVRSAASFVTWSVHPDDPAGPLKGVRRWTVEDELPKVIRAIDAGRPVPLGLVVARRVSAIGKNHQVVAHGYSRSNGTTSVLITDSNSPGREVTLTPKDGAWVASNGPTWRGFFVQDYARKKPTVLTRSPADPSAPVGPGSVVALSHVWTGRTLHSDRTPWAYPGAPSGQRVTAVRSAASDDERWAVLSTRTARDHVRLRHVASGGFLGSGRARSPVTGQQGLFVGPAEDEWRVEVDGGGAWTAGARVRLVHVGTGAALHSHPHSSDATGGQQEVTGFAGRDTNDWWTVLEVD
ncbi:dolichyl-phosphate-mannose--protein mannosyltransferase [Cellulomonas edaphi]|uniref:MIR domain-containing protein n=1 Tax=Cellulomonas edaphi TaxID=3053468 RepID=A0ABT7S2A5_9CELL|nr:hypothetical protein [Cellulomons edaphi]MDM7829754.1 hypothetical protein [Cellulomons edaphi]